MCARRRKSDEYRDVDGIVILDKALGLSSNRALQQLRGEYQARKAGHCGSLDPLASGVLPVCLGEATKFSSYLLGAGKSYRAHCRLGQVTTTGDAEGELVASAVVDVDTDRIEAVLAQFVGVIEQVPPMYSALKHEGKRLYQLAREGKEVERAPRSIEIYSLELLSFEDDTLVIDVACSKGTYIRTLAEDIGARLGCGAHLSALRRTRVDVFDEADAITIEQLQELRQQGGLGAIDAMLLPVATALSRFPEIVLNSSDSIDMCHGRPVTPGSSAIPGPCRMSSAEGDFIGLGEVGENGELVAKRLMNTAR
jgi:tRNA pseudouridine55 synthase